jgi:hypothetical protein
VLSAIIALLIALFGVSQFVGLYVDVAGSHFARAVNLDGEGFLPTAFSVLLLAGAGALLWRIGRHPEPKAFRMYWHGLSLAFFVLALDEGLRIHERASRPIGRWLEAHGIIDNPILRGLFTQSWVVAGFAVVVLIGIIYLPFLRHLAAGDRLRFIVAGSVYVGGALGMEMASGYHFAQVVQHDATYKLLVVIEEGMEMFGTTLFIRALLIHLARIEAP